MFFAGRFVFVHNLCKVDCAATSDGLVACPGTQALHFGKAVTGPRAVRDRIFTGKERMIETCAETHGEPCEDDEFLFACKGQGMTHDKIMTGFSAGILCLPGFVAVFPIFATFLQNS